LSEVRVVEHGVKLMLESEGAAVDFELDKTRQLA
jgi:hypothetical protein